MILNGESAKGQSISATEWPAATVDYLTGN
jgi:hypothetical protein